MLREKARRGMHLAAFRANHMVRSYEPAVWLVGDGRSGTTWVSNLINCDRSFRVMFEPFHPTLTGRTNFVSWHQYVRPAEINRDLDAAADQVFRGRIWHTRIDQDNRVGIFDGLLVKDIFANLFAGWVSRNHPRVKVVLLVRNPFSVALSKLKKSEWIWVTDPMSLWNQAPLREDYLGDFEDLIAKTSAENDFTLNQLLIWSIIHYVPFRQFGSDRMKVVFYEDAVRNPRDEIAGLSSFVGKELGPLPSEIISKPSRVASDKVSRQEFPINSWKDQLPAGTIDKGLLILEKFGLGDLYDAKGLPNGFDLDRF